MIRRSKYEMLDMDLANKLVFEKSIAKFPLGNEELDVTGESLLFNFYLDLSPGLVLAEAVTAKDDLPPFRASVMDGYAIKADVALPGTVLEVIKAKKGYAGTKASDV
jgi:hypothetical protein